MKLEELLNKLIEKGWSPMGNRPITQLKKNVKVERYNKKIVAVVIKNGRGYADDYYSLRDIISKESGLWQFVCENKMVPKENHERVYDVSWGEYGVDCKAQIISREPEYRLIGSALCDEDKLEEFLLNNIVLDSKQ